MSYYKIKEETIDGVKRHYVYCPNTQLLFVVKVWDTNKVAICHLLEEDDDGDDRVLSLVDYELTLDFRQQWGILEVVFEGKLLSITHSGGFIPNTFTLKE